MLSDWMALQPLGLRLVRMCSWPVEAGNKLLTLSDDRWEFVESVSDELASVRVY